jgi:hypothetical protein
MSSLTKLKIAFAGVGALLFGAGVRTELGWLRGVGVALVAFAWVLRFVRKESNTTTDATN